MNFTGVFKAVAKLGREGLSEGGTGSYSRILGALVATFTFFWVTYVVIKSGSLPDLTGPSIFIASGCSAYGINQAKNVASAIKGNPNGPQTDAEGTPPTRPTQQ